MSRENDNFVPEQLVGRSYPNISVHDIRQDYDEQYPSGREADELADVDQDRWERQMWGDDKW